ncbi:hypothetical protein FGO68_gene14274 [Halteria grandinella]|uniref:Uncharacterized protein n=1 Tax=Halteria grandinella TaxID=5974 RepID=A0A8J8NW22_HALGN|nr:hypothetical protein FGO68_gene14274 [Halteria grandinella]
MLSENKNFNNQTAQPKSSLYFSSPLKIPHIKKVSIQGYDKENGGRAFSALKQGATQTSGKGSTQGNTLSGRPSSQKRVGQSVLQKPVFGVPLINFDEDDIGDNFQGLSQAQQRSNPASNSPFLPAFMTRTVSPSHQRFVSTLKAATSLMSLDDPLPDDCEDPFISPLRSTSPWQKIASVVLSKGTQYKEQINKFNQYFELKIQTEQKTEKFPFERDAGIINILHQRLVKLEAEREAAERAKCNNGVKSQRVNRRKLTLGDTLKYLEELQSQIKTGHLRRLEEEASSTSYRKPFHSIRVTKTRQIPQFKGSFMDTRLQTLLSDGATFTRATPSAESGTSFLDMLEQALKSDVKNASALNRSNLDQIETTRQQANQSMPPIKPPESRVKSLFSRRRHQSVVHEKDESDFSEEECKLPLSLKKGGEDGSTGGNATPILGIKEDQEVVKKKKVKVDKENKAPSECSLPAVENPKKKNKYAHVKSKFLSFTPKEPSDTVSNIASSSTTSHHLPFDLQSRTSSQTPSQLPFRAPTSQELLSHSPYLQPQVKLTQCPLNSTVTVADIASVMKVKIVRTQRPHKFDKQAELLKAVRLRCKEGRQEVSEQSSSQQSSRCEMTFNHQ